MATPLHSRAQAGLRSPRSRSTNVRSEGDTAHYGGPSPWGLVDRSSPARFRNSCDHSRCASIWRAWQAYHMDSRGWVDIAYSSGVCPHGHRYEGRGPGVRTAAQGTNDGNNRSLATVYIAGDGDPLTDEAKLAFLDESRRLARLRWDHSDWKPTRCAGNPIRRWEATGWAAPSGGAVAPGGPQPLPPRPVAGSHRLLRRGVQGDDVREWQRILTGAGHKIAVDGIFGPQTEAATRAFQRTLKVTADGIVGPQTRAATARLFAWLAADREANKRPDVPPFLGTVRRGDRGHAVRAVQGRLRDRGWGIAVDGVFGPRTQATVTAFQREKGLTVDGIAGPETWATLWTARIT